jgi:hypothetical protein
MRFYVKVIPRSSQSRLEQQTDGECKAWVTAPPEKGKANQVLIGLIAQELGVKKRQVEIIAGKTSRVKLVEILKLES